MSILATIIGYIVILAVCALCFAIAMFTWNLRQDMTARNTLRGRISNMARWCGYEFPIAEDIAAHLLDGGDISQFRDKLRERYGRRGA